MSLLQRLGNYLLGSNTYASAAALIFATLSFLGIPTGFLSLIILALVSLVKGVRSAFIVLAWAILPALCMLYLHQWALLDSIALSRTIWVLALALLLRFSGSWQKVLEVAALGGFLVVLSFHLLIPDPQHWWAEILKAYFENLGLGQSLGLQQQQIQEFIKQVLPFATGAVVAGMLVGVFLLLVIARWWQKAMSRSPLSLGLEFSVIRMKLWDSGVILAAVVGCLLSNKVALDVLPILLFPFVVAGLSLLYYGAYRNKPEKLSGGVRLSKGLQVVLLISYLGLIFVPWIFAGILAVIGLIDSGFNIRHSVFDRKRVRA